jgi:hypothetical protein
MTSSFISVGCRVRPVGAIAASAASLIPPSVALWAYASVRAVVNLVPLSLEDLFDDHGADEAVEPSHPPRDVFDSVIQQQG